MFKTVDSVARLPGFISHFYHLVMMWPWNSCVTSLDLSFLICKSEVEGSVSQEADSEMEMNIQEGDLVMFGGLANI